MPAIVGAHHTALTVSDVERSAAWYADLLGLVVVRQGDDDVVSYRILAHPATHCVIGLRQYHGRPDGPFDEFRTGLDHLAFGVADRAELESWEAELAQRGDIRFTPIVDTAIGAVIVLRDPDNIQLELWLPSG
jgi:glyoxylase I family protein